MKDYIKLPSKKFSDVILRVVPGHFVTPNTHTNYFLDMLAIMRRQSEAKAAAERLAQFYSADTIVDSIVCLDGMDIIGAYMADELTRAGVMSMNAHKTMYILQPERDISGHLIFRDNIAGWIRNKNILLLLCAASSGRSVQKAFQTIKYYGGNITGISALFSIVSSIEGMPINSLFNISDIPDYHSSDPVNCPLCKARTKIDGIINGYGVSEL